MRQGFALLISGLLAQTPVVNPTTAEFTPSVDHATSLVTRYDLLIFPTERPEEPALIRDLAKPQPVDGVIRYNLAPALTLLPPGPYVARVAAVGPGGMSASELSNTFVVEAQVNPCTVGGPNGPVVIILTRLTRAVSRSDPEGAIMLFRASSVVPLKRVKIDVLETPEAPAWEMTYGAGTPTSDVRGFAVRPATIGTWPVVIEAEDMNGCIGKTDGTHRITVVP